jgi:hypothetical protein
MVPIKLEIDLFLLFFFDNVRFYYGPIAVCGGQNRMTKSADLQRMQAGHT